MVSTSIVIRTLNEGLTLGAVLEAVSHQNMSDFELIVADSGSTDNTLEIARSFKAHLIEIPSERFTYGYALNLGLAAAQGEFAVSLAGHAIPADPDWLKELLSAFADPRIAGCSSKQLTRQWLYRSWALTGLDILYTTFGIHSQSVTSKLFVNSSSAFRLSIWRNNPFDEQVPSCEDQLWSRQVLKMGYRFAYCPKSQVYHSHHLSPTEKIRCVRRDRAAMRLIKRRLQQQ
ncbi:MAG: glycosyltransferase family 2 protein [Anaerolineae bacterium]